MYFACLLSVCHSVSSVCVSASMTIGVADYSISKQLRQALMTSLMFHPSQLRRSNRVVWHESVEHSVPLRKDGREFESNELPNRYLPGLPGNRNA